MKAFAFVHTKAEEKKKKELATYVNASLGAIIMRIGITVAATVSMLLVGWLVDDADCVRLSFCEFGIEVGLFMLLDIIWCFFFPTAHLCIFQGSVD